MFFSISNGKKIQKIHIDNCVLKEGKKCDWMLLTDKQYEYFIELKGQHISEAVKQLENTIYQLSDNLKKQQRISFIITHIRPKMNPKIQILKSKFKRLYNSKLIIKNSPYEAKI